MTLVDIDTAMPVRRDRWGRYVVVPPEGGKPVGYQRATTLAKMLEDTSNLTDWACRMTLLGAAARPDIIASVLAANPDDRKTLNTLAAQAKEHGGANIRRDLGTAVHKFVELSHANPDYTVPEPYAADVAAINTAIDNAGFDVVTEFSERILVVDAIQVAGMCDLVLRRRCDGRLFIGDLKTGSSVKYGALGWATQLSIYSMADAIYEQGAADDGSDDRRLPSPDVDGSLAFIIHCEPQSGRADVHALSIGSEFVDLAVAVREIRKRRDLLVKFEGGGTDAPTGQDTAVHPAAPVVVGSVEVPNNNNAAAPVTPSGGPVSTPPVPEREGEEVFIATTDAIVHEATTAWLINRTNHLIAKLSKQHIGEVWPVDVPRPLDIKNGAATWSDGDHTAIDTALAALEAKHDVPFGDTDPRINHAIARLRDKLDAEPVAASTLVAPDDSGAPIADDNDVQRLIDNVVGMAQSADPKLREKVQRVSMWQRTANTTNPWRTRQGPNGTTSQRVYAIGLAAVACIDHIDLDAADPDHKVRNLLVDVLGEEVDMPANSVGAMFGALTLDQALLIGELA